MVKLVSGSSAKLVEAQKEIEKLTRKNEALSREIERLRASTTRSTPIRSAQKELSTCSSDDRETYRPRIKYDRPTQASMNRVAATRGTKPRTERTKRMEVRLNGGTYVYVEGRPIKIDDSDRHFHSPHYMQETQSSAAKKGEKCRYTAWGSPSWEWDSSFASMDDSSWTDEEGRITPPEDVREVLATPTKSSLRSWADLLNLLSSPRTNLIPDVDVRISSRAGFDLLTAGHHIAQEAFHDAARKFWPTIWRSVKEGRHAVRLGKLEIESYVEHVELSLCGSHSSAVLHSLYNLVHLRNKISHPHGLYYQYVEVLDDHLRAVEMFTLAVGDNERSAQTSSLRDELHRLAIESIDQVNRFFPLATLPFANEKDPSWESAHLEMFEDVLRHAASVKWRDMEGGCPDQCKGLLRAAETWALECDIELVY